MQISLMNAIHYDINESLLKVQMMNYIR